MKTGQNLKDDRSPKELRTEAFQVASNADIVLFIGGLNKSEYQDCEGTDRKTMDLPYNQNELIMDLLQVNKKLVVINISGTGVAMPWKNHVLYFKRGIWEVKQAMLWLLY